MSDYPITRAHLKIACEKRMWDLLDKFLEIDATHINDKSMFTDTWGSWWSMLCEVVGRKRIKGVQVLLKHGADPNISSWGDGIEQTPIEMAQDRPEILALLLNPETAVYNRKSDPPLPVWAEAEAEIEAINRQGTIRDQTGLVFQAKILKDNLD